jgi:hypothetical protein
MRAVDEIVLTLPRERPFYAVAHLVLGGLAARHNLTVEHLEDLKLAVDSVLAEEDGSGGDVTVRLRIHDSTIEAQIGPFSGSLPAELEREQEGQVGLRRILAAVVDDVRLADEQGQTWVTLAKSVGT